MSIDLAATPFHQLGVELAASSVLGAACVIIHGLGLALITRFIRPSDDPRRVTHLPPVTFHGIAMTIAIVLFLLVIHGAEIWLYAFFYLAVRALPDLSSALYFSTISYSTVGFSDALILKSWRNVAALESIVGVMMLGWSTAYFVRILGHIDVKRRKDASRE
tara:strand:- start:4327 stop:4812 length:486 start_codon:yes stop_codon:yes gene_type:complete